MEVDMDQFIRSQNVTRYHRLLERVTEQSDRQKILNLLAEEQQKQKDAGDPIQYPSRC
jgi:hypothetical protein